MFQTRRVLGALGAGLIASFVVYVALFREEHAAIPSDDVESNTTASAQYSSQPSDLMPDTSKSNLNNEVEQAKEIVASIYDADPDTRNAAILAMEEEMASRLQAHPNGWIRWQAVLIDHNSITNGDYLDEDAVAKAFSVTPFPGRTYKATQSYYRPRPSTASGTWSGILDDGAGSITVSIIETEGGPELILRLRTPDGQFTIMPTSTYGAYVVAESDVAYWSTQLVNN